jgi:hypothetical protein
MKINQLATWWKKKFIKVEATQTHIWASITFKLYKMGTGNLNNHTTGLLTGLLPPEFNSTVM